MIILGQIADDGYVGFCGTMRVITGDPGVPPASFLRSWVTGTCLFCDPTYLKPSTAADLLASVRRASGFVQIAFALATRLREFSTECKRYRQFGFFVAGNCSTFARGS